MSSQSAASQPTISAPDDKPQTSPVVEFNDAIQAIEAELNAHRIGTFKVYAKS